MKSPPSPYYFFPMPKGPWPYPSRGPKAPLRPVPKQKGQEEFLKVKWLLKFKVKGTLLPRDSLDQIWGRKDRGT